MAGASIKLDVEWESQAVLAGFQQLLAATSNLEPAFRDIGEALLPATRDWRRDALYRKSSGAWLAAAASRSTSASFLLCDRMKKAPWPGMAGLVWARWRSGVRSSRGPVHYLDQPKDGRRFGFAGYSIASWVLHAVRGVSKAMARRC